MEAIITMLRILISENDFSYETIIQIFVIG